jgi:hypothetical protein
MKRPNMTSPNTVSYLPPFLVMIVSMFVAESGKPSENGWNIHKQPWIQYCQYFCWHSPGIKTSIRHYSVSKQCLLTHFLIFYRLVWRSMLEKFYLPLVQTQPRKIT